MKANNKENNGSIKYIVTQRGDKFTPEPEANLKIHDSLPVGVYDVGFNPMSETFFLTQSSGFAIPSKVYGDDPKSRAERVLNTFHERESNTGVLLQGDKGTGKTLLAKVIAVKALEQGLPVIKVGTPYHGPCFTKFMNSLGACVVLIDEFEKVYEPKHQAGILSLMDGLALDKKLFLLTVNDTHKVNSYMINRPGRLFYNYKFGPLTPEFVEEFCKDRLKDQSHTESMVRFCRMFNGLSFDVLSAMVEDMNRYNDSPKEVMEHLNAEPSSADSTFELGVTLNGVDIVLRTVRNINMSDFHLDIRGHAITSRSQAAGEDLFPDVSTPEKVEEKTAFRHKCWEMGSGDLVSASEDGKRFEFVLEEEYAEGEGQPLTAFLRRTEPTYTFSAF